MHKDHGNINDECSKRMTKYKGNIIILQREKGDNTQLRKQDMSQKELCAKRNHDRLQENEKETPNIIRALKIGQEEETLFVIIQGSIQTPTIDKGRAPI